MTSRADIAQDLRDWQEYEPVKAFAPEMIADLERAADEIERLRALLKPFADYAQMIDENPASAELGDACPVLADPSQVHIAARPTLADLRRARSAFEQHAPKSVCEGRK